MFCNLKQVLLAVCAVALFSVAVECKGTAEQMAKAAEMMRSVCMGKVKVPLDHVEALGRGEFPDSKDAMCFANCVLETMQAMRKGKVYADQAIRSSDMLLPPEIGEPTKAAFDTCRDSADGIKNNCEAAYALLKCLHKNNPKYFFA
ncbi:general odorant-binding protein 72-like [Uranotaenia lowii]|uniref:general odorant-binding protein 72-like n=1 Tax=Uranotaenia lowii TaxID=190385 RepID=UPI00247887E4|nr:general odorant-binding protein 72-like [Uranotaenia lowii]